MDFATKKRLQCEILCGCGCGERFMLFDAKWRPRTYRPGHSWRGKERLTHKKERPNRASSHEYVRRRFKGNACQLAHIGSCSEVLEAAHINGDPFDNRRENIMTLCVSHHRLFDNGRIDLEAPKMPSFYVDGSGKRRYY